MLWFDDAAQSARVMHMSHVEALDSGDDGSIPLILANLAAAEYLAGRWARAEQAADDGYEAAMQTGQRPQQAYSLSVRALVRASLGREDEARADAARALTLAGERTMGAARIHSIWALGLLALSLDRPDEAVGLIAPLRAELLAAGVGEPGSVRFVPDEIEALIALGRLDEAELLVGWLGERGRTLDRASALGAAARCRGLLSAVGGDLDGAMNELEHSLAQYARVQIPFEVARTLLALGSTQRRARQKAAARTTLTSALASFEELGAAIWADKARNDLARIGGRSPSGDKLTPAEERVAALVAEGCSNKEVAASLFMSVRTVETHLAKIYAKLGIRSRTALARRSQQ
jgi:DNA-binding CsgD family transcriptional regulator